MPTLFSQEVPPCTLVLLTVCRRKLLLLLHPPSRSKSLLPLRGNTLSGLEAPSWLPSPPSNRCGSPSRNMMNPALVLFTGSASKFSGHLELTLRAFLNLRHALSILIIQSCSPTLLVCDKIIIVFYQLIIIM
jgi:hypothetical protein